MHMANPITSDQSVAKLGPFMAGAPEIEYVDGVG